mmetsp:Transcript_9516/g.8226  ORF Transcript_9516/g.8226 Transcript_9516/m.8226 type:complete len:268 (+) Transcript_9516:283-1086(+)
MTNNPSGPNPGAVITSMDVAVRKPLIATVGSDSVVRIWNYEDRSIECWRAFPEETLGIAIHPSGFHVAIGFVDRVRIMNVGYKEKLHDTSLNFPQIKSCKVIRFSNGGQYVAAANGAQSNHTIQIFSTYTGESIHKSEAIRGHSHKIKSLAFCKDDSLLVSCGDDPVIYVWRVADGTRYNEISMSKISTNYAIFGNDIKSIYASGNDKMLKDINDSDFKNLDCQVVLGPLTFTNSYKMMFGGVSDRDRASGSIRCFKSPIIGNFTEH